MLANWRRLHTSPAAYTSTLVVHRKSSTLIPCVVSKPIPPAASARVSKFGTRPILSRTSSTSMEDLLASFTVSSHFAPACIRAPTTAVLSRVSTPSRDIDMESNSAASRSSSGRNSRSQPAIGLRQLASERPPADDAKPLGQLGQIENRIAGEVAHPIESRDVRRSRPRTGGDNRLFERQRGLPRGHDMRLCEACVGEKHIDSSSLESLDGVILGDACADSSSTLHHGREIRQRPCKCRRAILLVVA
jgi:hypothetical protein